MVERALAWSPGHVSGYFRRCAGPDGAATGSIGGGIVIAEGVVVEAVVSDAPVIRVLVAPPAPGWPSPRTPHPLSTLMDRFDAPAALTTRCTLPIGAGFGLSAAALLASGAALSALHGLELSRAEIAAEAHEAEVRFRTGLGDVAAAQGGGVVVRRGPGVGAEISGSSSDEPVAAVSFGPIPTPGVLDSDGAMARVGAAFPVAEPRDLEQLVRPRDLRRAERARDRPGAGRARRPVRGRVPASMTMLGDGVFALGPGADRVLARFGRVHRLHVAREGFRLLEAGGPPEGGGP